MMARPYIPVLLQIPLFALYSSKCLRRMADKKSEATPIPPVAITAVPLVGSAVSASAVPSAGCTDVTGVTAAEAAGVATADSGVVVVAAAGASVVAGVGEKPEAPVLYGGVTLSVGCGVGFAVDVVCRVVVGGTLGQ